ncbi:MATE family efflux transporter [Dulcicalothrix desertica PCC 7102]|uniref:Probable multidrug resistance protein NorM n=1 Tax=Dulcicalothrix desertica PCC 7102 TaxID=232991 RepID=A0A3S1CS88_9CYAN|nr:MATE family efflux transporter [Dulcicalothrix desertica]RUS97421.1 MATE family efflux transporter [Dulcicalothrix desertica PCC 7102]TWH55598.1 MATE family multidrug resistance protein [Dulcicalothrix desertica PCC 7102]
MTSISLNPKLKTEIREFVQLAVPLASAQVTQSLTGFVDTVMMGRLGQEALAAGGLASFTFLVISYTASGVVMGVSPLVAEAYGEGKKTRVSVLGCQGLWLSLLIAIPTMFLIGHMDSLMIKFRQAVNTVTLANSYLDVMLWGLFPAVGFAMLRSFISGLSQARPVMVIVIGGTLFNIVGNYTLGYGKFGFPRMELAGLALSSALSHWLMFLTLVIYVVKHERLKNYRVFQNLHRIKPTIIRELLWIGAPIGIAAALESGLFAVVTYLMGILGTEVLAAHQIILQTTMVIYMVPLGMSFATTARVGQWLGQKNYEGIFRAGYVSIYSAAIFMTLTAVALLTHSQQVVGLFLDINNPENAKVLALATSMLTVAAFAQILDGVQKTTYGALQGLQDTRVPVILSLISFWGIGLTLGYFLGFHLGFGGTGLWLGQSIGVAISAGCFIWRFCKLLSKNKTQPF